MSKKVLTTPIQDKDLEDIKIGDVIYLTGYLVTARDAAHTRLVKLGRKLPVDLKGKAIFHAGPIMVHRKDDPTKFDVISIGPTTSMRMEKFQKQFLCQIRTVIFTEQLHSCDGRLYLVNPLFDVLLIFHSLSSNFADLLQHGFSGHF